MNTIICYASKTGTTKHCAEKLKTLLHSAELCDLTKERPDIAAYDCIIIGGSIRMGHLHKRAKKFIEKNKELLLQKKIAFFICNGFIEQAETFLLQNIDKLLLEHAICAASFGGELDFTRMKGLDKFVAKAVSNSIQNQPEAQPKVNERSIEEFAKVLLETE